MGKSFISQPRFIVQLDVKVHDLGNISTNTDWKIDKVYTSWNIQSVLEPVNSCLDT